MQAIATLLKDDPYLKLTPVDRIAARRDRLARLRPTGENARPDTPIVLRNPEIVAVLEMHAEPEPDIPPIDPETLFAAWVDRQREKHAESLKQFDDGAGLLQRPTRPAIELIQKVVAEHYGFNWQIMFCIARTAQVVRARQVAMYLAKTMTERSLPEIGRRFGGRDHTTVLHAVRKMTARVEVDVCLSADINHLKSIIVARLP